MDLNKLNSALDNTTNDHIIGFTTKKILELNLKILKELHLPRETTIEYLKKLKGYMYVDEVKDLKYGAFIRWMPITDPNDLQLKYFGLVCDIKITDEGVIIVCKNFMHRFYQFKMDECLIFQKLTTQELIILSALDHIQDEPNAQTKQTKQTEKIATTNANRQKKQKDYFMNDSDSESDDSDDSDDSESDI